MKWTRRGRSENLEDRRGQRPRSPFPGFGRGRGMPMPMPRGRGPKLGLGTVVLVVAVMWLLGINPLQLLVGGTVQAPMGDGPGAGFPGGLPDVGSREPFQASAAEEELVDFVSFVLDDAQAVWAKLLPGYRDARLVLFRDVVQSACGFAQAAMGPFYCPGDQKVYIDLGFYSELRRRFGAPGDFAQAYVLTHEIGHHVQRLTGTEAEVRRAQQRSPRQANALSVRLELQADCYAGVWAHSTAQRQILEHGDLREGLQAAAAVGDDRIQKMSRGRVAPESFTHGSSEQRMEWFKRGFDSGDPRACDTFS